MGEEKKEMSGGLMAMMVFKVCVASIYQSLEVFAVKEGFPISTPVQHEVSVNFIGVSPRNQRACSPGDC